MMETISFHALTARALYVLSLAFLIAAGCQYVHSRRNPVLMPEEFRGLFHGWGLTALLAWPIVYGWGFFVLFEFRPRPWVEINNLLVLAVSFLGIPLGYAMHRMIPEGWRDNYGSGIGLMCTLLGMACAAGFVIVV